MIQRTSDTLVDLVLNFALVVSIAACTLALLVFVLVLPGALLWFLWNLAIVPAFGANTLTFEQGIGLAFAFMLIGSLFFRS